MQLEKYYYFQHRKFIDSQFICERKQRNACKRDVRQSRACLADSDRTRHYFTYKWTSLHNPSNTMALICSLYVCVDKSKLNTKRKFSSNSEKYHRQI